MSGAPNLHDALAMVVGLPTSASDDELLNEVIAWKRRAGGLSYEMGDAQAACATQKFADVPLFPLDEVGA